MIAQVGTISANHDETIGRIIAEAMEKVGKDGVITVEEARTLDTSLEVVEGMQFDRGYLSPYFVTDPDRMEVVLENPVILIHEKKISSMKDLLPVLEQVGRSRPSAAHHRGGHRGRGAGDARRQQAARHDQGGCGEGARLRRSPQGDARRHGDSDERPRHHRGSRHQAGVHQDRGPRPGEEGHDRQGQHDDHRGRRHDRRPSQGRVKQLRAQVEDTTSDYDREKLQERLAKLVGGVAIIKVGAATETEMKEKKARVEDAMHATKAAVEEGIVPGGGVALLRAVEGAQGAEARRRRAARRQHRRRGRSRSRCAGLPTNAGHEGSIVVQRVKDMKDEEGFNAQTEQYENLVQAGVIDPTKVVRSALQNAASIASLLLTTEAVISQMPEPQARRAAHGGGRHGRHVLASAQRGGVMGALAELLATGDRQALEFFFLRLREVSEPRSTDRSCSTTPACSHTTRWCRHSPRPISSAPATLSAVFDHFVADSSLLHDSAMMETAGAQCLVLTGFFQDQMRHRHNIRWYADLGAGILQPRRHPGTIAAKGPAARCDCRGLRGVAATVRATEPGASRPTLSVGAASSRDTLGRYT